MVASYDGVAGEISAKLERLAATEINGVAVIPYTLLGISASDVKENPASGYLSTARAAANKGYSAIMFSCNVSPDGGQELVEETLGELEHIK